MTSNEAIDHPQQRIFKEFKEYLIPKIEINEGLIIYLYIFKRVNVCKRLVIIEGLYLWLGLLG